MEQASALVDLVIAVLQSLVVLLLASGFYVALVARKPDDEPAEAAKPRGPRRLGAADSLGS